jgi:hypothetical protein
MFGVSRHPRPIIEISSWDGDYVIALTGMLSSCSNGSESIFFRRVVGDITS